MDDDKKQIDISRGKRAELLLQDELLVEAFETLEKTYFEGWKASALRDTDGRERVFHAIQVLGNVKKHLQTAVSNGKIAQKDLEDLVAKQKRGVFG